MSAIGVKWRRRSDCMSAYDPKRTSASFLSHELRRQTCTGQFGVVNFEQTRITVGLTLINTPPTLGGLFYPGSSPWRTINEGMTMPPPSASVSAAPLLEANSRFAPAPKPVIRRISPSAVIAVGLGLSAAWTCLLGYGFAETHSICILVRFGQGHSCRHLLVSCDLQE